MCITCLWLWLGWGWLRELPLPQPNTSLSTVLRRQGCPLNLGGWGVVWWWVQRAQSCTMDESLESVCVCVRMCVCGRMTVCETAQVSRQLCVDVSDWSYHRLSAPPQTSRSWGRTCAPPLWAPHLTDRWGACSHRNTSRRDIYSSQHFQNAFNFNVWSTWDHVFIKTLFQQFNYCVFIWKY